MNAGVIKALLKKDIALFMSNRFYMLITIVGLVFYVGIYFVLPAQLDEKLSLAMYAKVVPPAFTQLTEHEGVDVKYFSTEESLKQAILDGDYQVAVALPPGIMETWATGGKPQITVYYASTAPLGISSPRVGGSIQACSRFNGLSGIGLTSC